MGNDTRPSRRVKDDENSNSNGLSASSSASASASASTSASVPTLRRSSRETLAKKAMAASTSPSVSVRKSERLEKNSSERVEKKSSPTSRLRRFDRGKATLSTSSGSKKSDQNSSSEDERCEKRDSERKKRRLDAQSNKAVSKKLWKKVKASDHSEKLEREDNLSQGDVNNCRNECDGINECSERRVDEVVDDNVATESFDDELEITSANSFATEKLRITEGHRGVKGGHDVITSNRKRTRKDGECDGFVTGASKKIQTSIASSTSLTKDRGENEVITTMGLAEKHDNHVRQNESPRAHLDCRCVKKRLESGVRSVSGAESSWDIKEVEVSDVDGAYGSTADNLANSLSWSPVCMDERTRANCTSTSWNYNFEWDGRRKLHETQKSLHLSLKPQIFKLCKILNFSDNAEGVVEEFLEYVMNNHHISTESATILQAFQISLCWIAASVLKQKISRKKSVALAKRHLNFNCSQDEAEIVYSKLRFLKRMFSYRTGKLEEMEKKCHEKLNKLIQEQQAEKNGLVQRFVEDRVRIEEKRKMEITVIRSCLESNTSMRVDKLKLVDISFSKEVEELEHQKDTLLKKLEAQQLAARRKIQDGEDHRVDTVKSLAFDESLGKTPSSEPDDNAGEVTSRFLQTNSSSDGANNLVPVNVNPSPSGEQICDVLTLNVSEKEVQWGVPETIDCDDLENLDPVDGPLLKEQIPGTNAACVPINEKQLSVPENVRSYDGNNQEQICNGLTANTSQKEDQLGVSDTVGSSDGLANSVLGDGPFVEEQIPDTTAASVPTNEIQLRVPENVSSGGCDTEEQISNGLALNVLEKEVQLGVAVTIVSGDDLENLVPGDGPLLEEKIPYTTAVSVSTNEKQLTVPENTSSGDHDTEEQISNGLVVNMSEKDVQLGVPDTTASGDDLENHVSGDGPFLEEQIPDTTATSVHTSEMQLRVLENVSSGDGDTEERIHNGLTLNVSEKEAQVGFPGTIISNDGLENLVPEDGPLLEENFPDTTAVSVPINEKQLRVAKNVSSGDGDSEQPICNGLMVNVSEKEVQLGVPKMIGCMDDLEDRVSRDEPLEEQIPGTTTASVPTNEMQLIVPGNVSSGDGDTEEQICNGLTMNVSEKEVQLAVPDTIVSSEGLEKLVSENGPLLEEQIPGNGPLLEEQIPDIPAASLPINEMQLRVPADASSGDGNTICSFTEMLLAEQIPHTVALILPGGEDALPVSETCDEVAVNKIGERNDEAQIVTSTVTTGMNQQDKVDNAINEDGMLQELSQVNSSSAQPTMAMTNGDAVSVNQIAMEEAGDFSPCYSELATQFHLLPSSNSPSSYNAVDVPCGGEVANLPISEGCTLNPATELVVNPPVILNQSISQPSTSYVNRATAVPIGALGMHVPDMRTSVASEFNNRPAQTRPTSPLAPPCPYSDLFQKELEWFSRALDLTCKDHENKKLHLQSEFNKEIAQICLKYEIKQQEIDVEYFTKKEEYDDNRNKVWMNKIYADAWFKCVEVKSSGTSGKQQDVNASFRQARIQPSMQQNAQRPPAANSSSAISPAVSMQALVPEPNPTIPAPPIHQSVIVPSTTHPPPAQGDNPPSALFPSAMARPPQISSVSYSNRNLQGGPQIRACPPHLRSSPPATSLPHPRRMLTPLPMNTPAPQSNTLPCLPPRLPSSTSDWTLRPETYRGFPAPPNILSALELLWNVERPPATSPSLAQWVPSTGQLNTSDFSTSSVPVNLVSTSRPNDVVYLSDDD